MIDEIEWRYEPEEYSQGGEIVRMKLVLWAKKHDGEWFRVPVKR